METRGTIVEIRVIERVVSLTDRHRRVDIDLINLSAMNRAVHISLETKMVAYELTTGPVVDPSSSTFDPTWGPVRVRVREAVWRGCRSFDMRIDIDVDVDVNVNIGLYTSAIVR